MRLTAGPRPAVGWDGSPVEPWAAGELRLRLQSALNPEPLGAVDQRPIIDLDSDMGRTLAAAGVMPLVTDDGFDLGAIVAACAERGWGAQVSIPLGATPVTPADATVTTRNEKGRTAGAHRTGTSGGRAGARLHCRLDGSRASSAARHGPMWHPITM